MIQIPKNEVFGHFLEFGTLDLLDIAYFDRATWWSQFANCNSYTGSFKIQKNAFLDDQNSKK